MHLFYQPDPSRHFLEDEEARHCAKVLRARIGDSITVIDGQGTLTLGSISAISPRRIDFQVLEVQKNALPAWRINMAICPTRKVERNEWMVEKMTELGVHSIRFIVSEHTHRETMGRVLNLDRLRKIALSAMKQSQQYYLPDFAVFSNFDQYVAQVKVPERYIAYVTAENSPPHLINQIRPHQPVEVLIGPEGDFSTNEIEKALRGGFRPVSLGGIRLRTETAAVAACHCVTLAQIL